MDMPWGGCCAEALVAAAEFSAEDVSAFPFVKEREELFIVARNNLNCHSEPIRQGWAKNFCLSTRFLRGESQRMLQAQF